MYTDSESFEYDLHHIAIHEIDHGPRRPDYQFVSAIQQGHRVQQHDHDLVEDDVRAAVQDYTYRQAPANQIALLDAPPPPDHVISPDRRLFALLGTYKYRSLEGLSAKEIGVAGLRIDPQT